jgi:prophage DNA circulation protein
VAALQLAHVGRQEGGVGAQGKRRMSLLSQRIRARLEEAKQAGTKLTMDQVESIIVCEEDQLAALNPPPGRKMKKEELDALFDALAEIQGCNPHEITKTAKNQVVVARKEILEVSPATTAEDIHMRAKEYKRRWPTWPLSATALSKHWAELGPAVGRTQAARKDIYQEPTSNWREAFEKVIGMPPIWEKWHDVPSNYRVQILQSP